jgi:hypothetical protein
MHDTTRRNAAKCGERLEIRGVLVVWCAVRELAFFGSRIRSRPVEPLRRMPITRATKHRCHIHSGKYPRLKFPAQTGQLAQITRSTLVTRADQGCNCKRESNAGDCVGLNRGAQEIACTRKDSEGGREKDLPSQCAIVCTIEEFLTAASPNGLAYPLFSINLQYNEMRRSGMARAGSRRTILFGVH